MRNKQRSQTHKNSKSNRIYRNTIYIPTSDSQNRSKQNNKITPDQRERKKE